MVSQAGIQEGLRQAEQNSGRYASRVMTALHTAADKTGIRFDALATTAAIESGMNPNAKASSSSATGLFQFVDQTWLATVKRAGADHGLAAQAAAIVRRGGQYTVEDPAMRKEILELRKDPDVSAAMAGEHLKDLSSTMTQSIGHAPDVTETYMGHFLGAGGAAQMLNAMKANPNAPASDVLPDAARANPSMFNGLSVSQFISKVRGRVEKAYSDLNIPVPQGGLQLAGANTASGGAGSGGADGSEGWGKGSPKRLGSAPERLMLASLAEVFTRIDKSMHGHRTAQQQKSMMRGATQNLSNANTSI